MNVSLRTLEIIRIAAVILTTVCLIILGVLAMMEMGWISYNSEYMGIWVGGYGIELNGAGWVQCGVDGIEC